MVAIAGSCATAMDKRQARGRTAATVLIVENVVVNMIWSSKQLLFSYYAYLSKLEIG